MADKLIPTAEAVEALARAAHDDYEGRQLDPVLWGNLTPARQHAIREGVLRPLLAAYPQIVADVLNHYADAAQADMGLTGELLVGAYMREQAAAVLS